MALNFGGGLFALEGKVKESRIWSCPGTNFKPTQPDVDDIQYSSHTAIASGNTISWFAPISLPDGATIYYAVVIGNATAGAETWELSKCDNAGTSCSQVGGANINIQAPIIYPQNAEVDNLNSVYVFRTSSLDAGDKIYGALIMYTIEV